jgi:2-methylcitrate dehydratase PrpD
MRNNNLTDIFVDSIYSIKYEHFTELTIKKVKECLLDYIGVTIAGAKILKEKGDKILAIQDDNDVSSSVIGFKRKASLSNSILVNGLSSHVLELDDGVRYGAIHPGAPIFSALLPVAEKYNVKWEEFLLGIVTGYETSIRLACSIQPSHYNAGYHPTSTCCTIGVAVGIAMMIGLSLTMIKDAFSASAISAAGTLKVIENTSELKPFNIGRASLMGFIAVMIAQAEFKGPEDVLSGNAGFLSMMSREYDQSFFFRQENDIFKIHKAYIKPYASCRHTHPAIEASLKLKSKYNISNNDIKKIRVLTYKGVIGKHDGQQIYGETSAKMSIPFSVAVSLIMGNAGINEFSLPYISDENILELTKRVTVYSDEELNALVPHKRAAIVEIEIEDGSIFKERIDYPKGEPENPLSDSELIDKFYSLWNFAGRDKEKGKRVIEILQTNKADLKEIMSLII